MTDSQSLKVDPFRAAVVIPTYNRREHLRAALLSAMAQSVAVELVVMDDGSTDGTAEMIRSEFPRVQFEQHPGPNGPCFLRNRGSEVATAPVLFPIDDDSVFASPNTIAQTLAEFDDPRVGAVGIPFINVYGEGVVRQRAPQTKGIYVTDAYVGAAHALRRDLFLELGGYRAQYFYMGEEQDYCIRLLQAGYVVRLGNADPIHHHESPNRSFFRADWYGRRNDVLFLFYNAPGLLLPAYLIGTTVNGVRYGLSVGRTWRMVRGLASGWVSIPREWGSRRSVSRQTFKLNRLLKRQPQPLEQIERMLPTIRE